MLTWLTSITLKKHVMQNCWNIYSHVNWHLTSNYLCLNQKQLCSSRCPCCIHGTVFILWTHEVQCWTRGTSVTCTQSICHRRTAEVSWFYSATLYIYIYIIWHCKNTVCMYMNGKSLWNSFSDEWKKNRKTDFGWNEICMKHAELEASLNQSFLFSSTQCNMSESSIYIATNLLHIMVYNTSIILMQSCETLLCALLVINSWKTANMHKTVTHHSLLY